MTTTETRLEFLVEIVEQPVEVSINTQEYVEASIEDVSNVEVEILPGGIVTLTSNGESISAIGDLSTYQSVYKELTYSGSVLSSMSIWDNADKDNLLVTKVFSYGSGTLVQQVIQDFTRDLTLTLTYNYSGSNLSSIISTIS